MSAIQETVRFVEHRADRRDDETMIFKGMPSTVRPISKQERRGNRRCKITQVLRVRPSNPANDHFEDVRGTVSVSRSGAYFHSNLHNYEVGMRLFVTLPYSEDPTSVSREYLAEVARVDPLVTGNFGIGIKLLMEIALRHGYPSAPEIPRE